MARFYTRPVAEVYAEMERYVTGWPVMVVDETLNVLNVGNYLTARSYPRGHCVDTSLCGDEMYIRPIYGNWAQ
jgi:hypothetical protein